jgi:hypothetical protein
LNFFVVLCVWLSFSAVAPRFVSRFFFLKFFLRGLAPGSPFGLAPGWPCARLPGGLAPGSSVALCPAGLAPGSPVALRPAPRWPCARLSGGWVTWGEYGLFSRCENFRRFFSVSKKVFDSGALKSGFLMVICAQFVVSSRVANFVIFAP